MRPWTRLAVLLTALTLAVDTALATDIALYKGHGCTNLVAICRKIKTRTCCHRKANKPFHSAAVRGTTPRFLFGTFAKAQPRCRKVTGARRGNGCANSRKGKARGALYLYDKPGLQDDVLVADGQRQGEDEMVARLDGAECDEVVFADEVGEGDEEDFLAFSQ